MLRDPQPFVVACMLALTHMHMQLFLELTKQNASQSHTFFVTCSPAARGIDNTVKPCCNRVASDNKILSLCLIFIISIYLMYSYNECTFFFSERYAQSWGVHSLCRVKF